MKAHKGNIVTLKSEYMDIGEDRLIYIATDDMEKGRISIKAINELHGFIKIHGTERQKDLLGWC